MANYRLRVGATPAPAWLSAPVGEWAQISSTTAPTELKDYSGAGFRDDGTVAEIFAALGGGHNGNVTSNRAMVLDLTADAPAWAQVRASSDPTGYDSSADGYFQDGTPGPRHLYNGIVWSPSTGEYVITGRDWDFGGAGTVDQSVIDGYVRASNSWRAAGYFPARPVTAWTPFSVADPSTGILYASNGDESNPETGYQLNPTTLAISAWHSSSGIATGRGPNAWDSTRGNVFQFGPQTYTFHSATVVASLQISTSGTKTAISIAASTAYTEFLADLTAYLSAAMVYDQTGDCFYWYNGEDGLTSVTAGRANRVYKITPNGTSTWDMSAIDGGGVTVPSSRQGSGPFWDYIGTNSQLFYVDRWRVLVLIRPGNNVHYLRVA